MEKPDLSTIGPELIDIGILIGLLGGTEGSPTLNTGWFQNPKQGITENFNWPNLKPLIDKILGTAANPLDTNAGPFNENWYSIKTSTADGTPKDSGYYFVEKTVGNNALLGVGIQHAYTVTVGAETVTIQPFIYVPVFQMPAVSGGTPLFSLDINGPVEIGVEFTCSDSFTYNGTAYNGMIFVASFNFSSPQPDITFLLKEPGGTFAPFPTITKSGILDSILALPAVLNFLNGSILPTGSPINPTWGGLLNSVGWLTTPTAPYSVGTISFSGAPGEIKTYIEKLLFAALNTFLGQNKVTTLLSRTGTKTAPMSWQIGLVCDNGNYGINVQVTNIQVATNPQINLQFGALTQDGTDWISNAGGTDPVGMGLNFYFLSGTAPNVSFNPHFEAINIGFDFAKASGQPLFDVQGYAIKEFQPRGYFSTLQNNAWGVAAAVDNISLPLVPTKGGGGSVAQTLLSSASGSGGGSAKPSVNPEFSFIVAYLSKFYLQLFDENNKPEDVVIIPIQKSFGPVEVKDIGIGWKNSELQLLFEMDGGLNLNALSLELDKLTIGIPITTPSDLNSYTLDLDGFDLSFSSGDISLAGGFLKNVTHTYTEYNGAVAIQAARWGITALGSFASLNGNPSLFIFGALNAPLGGPPFFFVTGVALGFGYNRKIVMPGIQQVQNFPFVQAAINPSLFSGKSSDDVLTAIDQYVPPQLGEYWLAAGIKFTSFELLDSFALLMVQFGKNVEIDLLGFTTLQLPKQVAGAPSPYVNAEMAIEVVMDPADGVLSVLAQLTDNSYVIDTSCAITGGFAFNIWFSGEHSGDFVVTMGGYNANFTVPSYYPTVPRLGFNWNVSSSINFSGDAYFALTPSCVMAGGDLSLTYHDGDLQAWFKASADFLISWKPFHYDIDISISIGVSYRINLLFVHKTITVELGVGLNVYGPEFGGEAHVHLWIISFTIGFGADNNGSGGTIDWPTFTSYFLPKNDSSTSSTPPHASTPHTFSMLSAVAPTTGTNVIKLNTGGGLSNTYTDTTTATPTVYWLVNPGTFNFNVESAIPATQITFNPGTDGLAPAPFPCNSFGLRPLGSVTLSGSDSTLTVGVQMQDDTPQKNFNYIDISNWNFSPTTKNVPQALWGTVNTGAETPSAASVPAITSALASASPPHPVLSGPAAFLISLLAYDEIGPKNVLTLTAGAQAPVVTLSSTGSLTQIQNTLVNATTHVNQNTGLFAALQDLGSLANQNDNLAAMATEANDIFRDSPMLVAGTTQTLTTQSHMDMMAAPPPTSPPTESIKADVPDGHRLLTAINNYNFGGGSGTTRVMRGGFLNTNAHNLQNRISTNSNNPVTGIFSMQAGSLHVWELKNVHTNSVFSYDGHLGLRILLFDKNLEIILEEYIPVGAPGFITIPPTATEMVLRTFDSAGPSALMGWHSGTNLPLLNPKYLMGRGCLVRPKSPQRIGRKQYSMPTGVSNGRNVSLKNKVEIEHGNIGRGWTETRFASTLSKVFVLGRPDFGLPEMNMLSDAFEVKVIYTDASGKKQAQHLTYTTAGISGKELWASFEVPNEALAAGVFSIWVQTSLAIYLAGIGASNTAIDEWNDDLTQELLAPESYLHGDNAGQKTELHLENALLQNQD